MRDEPGEVLGQHRVALVRHGGGALLPFGEELLGLEHLGALEVADLDRQPLDRGGDHGERREEHGVTVAGDDLGRDRLDRQPHLLGDVFLDVRIDVGEGADGAGDGAGRDLALRLDQAQLGALELGIGLGELQPEGRRLGVDAVRAADRRRRLVLEGAAADRGEKPVEVGEQQVRRPHQLDGKAGVEHVGRGHALVHEARLGADELGQVSEEGDDVVLHLALDLVDARGVEDGLRAFLPDRRGGLARHHAELRQRRRRVRLDLEPDAEARLGRPDRHHLGTAVAGDHRLVVPLGMSTASNLLIGPSPVSSS